MFKKRESPAPVAVPSDRINAIAARSAPSAYSDVGGRTRRERRKYIFKQAVAVMEHGERAPIVIKNISPTGMRVEYFQKRMLGELLLVSEPSIPLHAWTRVVWELDGTAGLQFLSSEEDES